MEDAISRTELIRELNAQVAVNAITKETAQDILDHLPPIFINTEERQPKVYKCGCGTIVMYKTAREQERLSAMNIDKELSIQ